MEVCISSQNHNNQYIHTYIHTQRRERYWRSVLATVAVAVAVVVAMAVAVIVAVAEMVVVIVAISVVAAANEMPVSSNGCRSSSSRSRR